MSQLAGTENETLFTFRRIRCREVRERRSVLKLHLLLDQLGAASHRSGGVQ